MDQRDREFTVKRLLHRLKALGFDVNVKDRGPVASGSDPQTPTSPTPPLAT